MKRLFTFAAAIIALFLMTSCEKEGSGSPSAALVGTWEVSEIEMIFEGIPIRLPAETAGIDAGITFSNDGSGYFYTNNYGESEVEPFTYTYSKGKLKIYSEYEDEYITLPVTVSGKKMTITVDENILEEPGAKGKIYLVKK